MSDIEKRPSRGSVASYGAGKQGVNTPPTPNSTTDQNAFKSLYYNPILQVVMLGFVCFMGPGLFNALNGLGGGGQLDASTSANANSALYATFAAMAFFSG